MKESPIRTNATIVEIIQQNLYYCKLPNGKIISSHSSKSLKNEDQFLKVGSSVLLELTPYDFDKARIAELIDLN